MVDFVLSSASLLMLTILPVLGAGQTLSQQASGCKDASHECSYWAQKHECVANPFYMRKTCRKACKACEDEFRNFSWPGYATEKGTRQYATMVPSVSKYAAEGHFRKDTSMGSYWTPGQRVRSTPWLTLSSFGVGTYLGDADEATDDAVTAAIIKAIYSGLNVVDTASNYREGRGEHAVGKAIRAMRDLPGFSREMIFISTKAGFVKTALLRELLASGKIQQADLQGGINCISPACLQGSLDKSLKALQLGTVDVLYLHNVAEMSSSDLGTPAFWSRLMRAFEWLEKARAKNLIRAYGMATWTCFRASSQDSSFLSLQKVVELAERVGGREHGFRYVQLPINAGMPEAFKEPWQPLKEGSQTRHVTLLQAAAALGVGVFASGPLGEGSLMKNSQIEAKLDRSAALLRLPSLPKKLLQLVRSTPLLLGTVVGMKTKGHVEENLGLVHVKPLSGADFEMAAKEL